MVTGPAAKALGILARDRWRELGGEHMPPVGAPAHDLWPSDITPDLADVNVAISRTMPGIDAQSTIRECEALFLDSIARAKASIYIESQYFTNDKLGAALAARLREPRGPEIVVVAPRECHGWIELNTMGAFRDRVFRELNAADTHQRLRLVYPAASRSRGVPTFIHSKVMIVDDVMARIGSANFSRRSMGVDSECDLAVEANGNRRGRAGIHGMRNRLLAEHLGMPEEDVANGIADTGSVCALIDARAQADRTLVRIETPVAESPLSEALRAAADPDEPLGIGSPITGVLPAADATGTHRGVGAYVMAALVRIPLELFVIGAGVLLGAKSGGVIAWLGVAGRGGRGLLGRPRDWRDSSLWLDEPSIVPIGKATGGTGRHGCDRAAPGIRCDRGINQHALRCGAGALRDLHGRDGDRDAAGDRCTHRFGRRGSLHLPRSIAAERSDRRRWVRAGRPLRDWPPYVDGHASVRAIALEPSCAGRVRLMRVATYNVHACIGTDGRHDPDRVATVIGELNADIVALQEFTYPVSVALDTRSPVVLTTLDQYQCALGPTRQNVTQCFGNALFTRHPIVDVHRIDLSMERREPRGALAATVDVGGTPVHVLAVHLGLRIHERRFQMRQILTYLDSVRDTLFVVLGDFNDWLPGRTVVHLLDRRLGRPPRPASFPVFWPVVALDRIWVHPTRALRRVFTHATPASRIASDHYPVVADIDAGDSSA